MRSQVTRVMLFNKQTSIYTLSAETGYKWTSHPLSTADPSDLHDCPTEYPKNVQVSPTEWLFFGGGLPDLTASDLVTHLDTNSHRLTKLTQMPDGGERLAHQVIFVPETKEAVKGSVYILGGVKGYLLEAHTTNYKYDIASSSFKELPDWNSQQNSFNLLPLNHNRYILVVSDRPYLFDTETEQWIELQ